MEEIGEDKSEVLCDQRRQFEPSQVLNSKIASCLARFSLFGFAVLLHMGFTIATIAVTRHFSSYQRHTVYVEDGLRSVAVSLGSVQEHSPDRMSPIQPGLSTASS